jgi:hypothetical protein
MTHAQNLAEECYTQLAANSDALAERYDSFLNALAARVEVVRFMLIMMAFSLTLTGRQSVSCCCSL